MNTTDPSVEEASESEPQVVILFLFFALLLGAVVTYLLSRYCTWLPYTAVIFVLGAILSVIAEEDNDKNVFDESAGLWDNIEPELILFIFIPALIFGEVTNLNLYHVRGSIIQAVLLAGPGAILGAVLMAICIDNGFLPFELAGWSTNLSYLVSAILCATDPVSVIALLNRTPGASNRLKYTITGESLMNDATALILYNIFVAAIMKNEEAMTPTSTFIYFLKVVFISPALGCSFGVVSVWLTSLADQRFREEDKVIQIAIPIVCAYLSFFMGEHVCGVSGILTCCSSGIMFSWLNPSLFRQHETLHSVWVAIEWIGNTLIFLLAGLVIGDRSLRYVSGHDFANMIVLYILTFLIRAVLIGGFYPFLKRYGKGCSAKEAAFMVFGGLRGAISITLALSLNQSVTKGDTTLSLETGHTAFFYIGGVSAMTLLINATLAGPVLQLLGIGAHDDKTGTTQLVQHYARKRISAEGELKLLKLPPAHMQLLVETCSLIDYPNGYNPDTPKTLRHNSMDIEYSPTLSSKGLRTYIKNVSVKHGSDSEEEEPFELMSREEMFIPNEYLMSHVRNAFLEIVRTYYWKCVNEGSLTRNSSAMRILLTSIDVGFETIHTPGLQDWSFIDGVLKENKFSARLSVVEFFEKLLPFVNAFKLWHAELQVLILTNFIAAHEMAQRKIPRHFGEHNTVDTPEQALVIEESEENVEEARKLLAEIDENTITLQKSKQIARTIFHLKENLVSEFGSEGILSEHDSEILLHEISHDVLAMERAFSRAGSGGRGGMPLNAYKLEEWLFGPEAL